MFVYKISNTVNNKVYIGQTIRPIEQRFKRHLCDAEKLDTHFARAIRKYGKDKFYIELIDTASTQNELNLKEQYWIRQYNSVNSDYGYNETNALTKCGGNTYQSKTTQEMSIIEDKIRQSKIGDKNPNARAIKCFNINTNEELVFETVRACQEYFHERNHRFVTTRVMEQVSGLYRNEWKIAYADSEYPHYHRARQKFGVRLLAVDRLLNTTKIFDSMRHAARELQIDYNKIAKQIRELKNTTFQIDNYEFTVLN